MISATANHLARKVSSSKKFSSILTETFNRPAFNVGQIFQPFDAYGRSLYSKLVKRDGEKKNSNSSGQTVWYDPDGYIQPAKVSKPWHWQWQYQ